VISYTKPLFTLRIITSTLFSEGYSSCGELPVLCSPRVKTTNTARRFSDCQSRSRPKQGPLRISLDTQSLFANFPFLTIGPAHVGARGVTRVLLHLDGVQIGRPPRARARGGSERKGPRGRHEALKTARPPRPRSERPVHVDPLRSINRDELPLRVECSPPPNRRSEAKSQGLNRRRFGSGA
jgi:hypothetical protein